MKGFLRWFFFSFGIIHSLAFLAFLVITCIYTGGELNYTIFGQLSFYITQQSAYSFYLTTPVSKMQMGVLTMFIFFFSSIGLYFLSEMYRVIHLKSELVRISVKKNTDIKIYHNVPLYFYAMSISVSSLIISTILGQNQIEFLIPSFFVILISICSIQNNGIYDEVSLLPSAFSLIFGLFPSFVYIQNYANMVNTQPFTTFTWNSFSGFIITWLIIYYIFMLTMFMSVMKNYFSAAKLNIALAVISTVFNVFTAIYFITLAVPNDIMQINQNILKFILKTTV